MPNWLQFVTNIRRRNSINRTYFVFAAVLILGLAAPPSHAWEMLGRVVIIGPVSARAITQVDDPDHDALVMKTDAILFEGSSQAAQDDDLCIFKTKCKSKAVDVSVCPHTDYCGRGGAEERLSSNHLIPVPFTRRE